MGETEKREILGRLREGHQVLLDAVAGISEADAARKPPSEGWSVLEIVEHLGASEAILLHQLRQAVPAGESREDRAREARFEGLALNRERKIEAPEPVRPSGACGSLAEALQRFEVVRGQTLTYVEEFEGDLRSCLVQHPLIARPVNCYEMLLLMALHPRRHAAQIVEGRQR